MTDKTRKRRRKLPEPRTITDNEKSLAGKFTTQRIANALRPWNGR